MADFNVSFNFKMALFHTFKIIAGAILSGIIGSSAIFVYILRHLFMYQTIKLV